MENKKIKYEYHETFTEFRWYDECESLGAFLKKFNFDNDKKKFYYYLSEHRFALHVYPHDYYTFDYLNADQIFYLLVHFTELKKLGKVKEVKNYWDLYKVGTILYTEDKA